MIHLLELCGLTISNGLSLGVWLVSNIFTHISHFSSWIIVICSSFMCFDEFFEFIDLRTNMEIETKKPEKRDKSWRRSKQNQGERSRAGHSPIMGPMTAQKAKKNEKPEASLVVRQNPAERSPRWRIVKILLRANVCQLGVIDCQAGRSFSWYGRMLARPIFSIDFLADRSPNSAERLPNFAYTKTTPF